MMNFLKAIVTNTNLIYFRYEGPENIPAITRDYLVNKAISTGRIGLGCYPVGIFTFQDENMDFGVTDGFVLFFESGFPISAVEVIKSRVEAELALNTQRMTDELGGSYCTEMITDTALYPDEIEANDEGCITDSMSTMLQRMQDRIKGNEREFTPPLPPLDWDDGSEIDLMDPELKSALHRVLDAESRADADRRMIGDDDPTV